MEFRSWAPAFIAGGCVGALAMRWLQSSRRRELPFFKASDPLYFDYNATTPIDPEVASAMDPFLYEEFGNPSSSYAFGKRAKQALQEARNNIAQLIHCEDDEVYFTSGATESLNWAIKGIVEVCLEGVDQPHIIISSVEHVVVLEIAKYLSEQHGVAVTELPVNDKGRVDVEDLKKALTKKTVLVSVMLANNETGTIQPIQEIVKAAKAYNPAITVHTDASQAVGKIPVSVVDLKVDLLTIAGHKLYAPKGVGALFVASKTRPALNRLLHGAHGQEGGMRAGTENVLLAVGLGHACKLARNGQTQCHMRKMRDLLQDSICNQLQEHMSGPLDSCVRINSDLNYRLPNTLSISFKNIQSSVVLSNISTSIAASAGSACHSGECKISRVLQMMHLDPSWAMGTVRLSVGKYTTAQQVEKCASILVAELLKQGFVG